MRSIGKPLKQLPKERPYPANWLLVGKPTAIETTLPVKWWDNKPNKSSQQNQNAPLTPQYTSSPPITESMTENVVYNYYINGSSSTTTNGPPPIYNITGPSSGGSSPSSSGSSSSSSTTSSTKGSSSSGSSSTTNRTPPPIATIFSHHQTAGQAIQELRQWLASVNPYQPTPEPVVHAPLPPTFTPPLLSSSMGSTTPITPTPEPIISPPSTSSSTWSITRPIFIPMESTRSIPTNTVTPTERPTFSTQHEVVTI